MVTLLSDLSVLRLGRRATLEAESKCPIQRLDLLLHGIGGKQTRRFPNRFGLGLVVDEGVDGVGHLH